MHRASIFFKTAVIGALLLSQPAHAQAQHKPAAPPRNPFLSQSNNSIAHANPRRPIPPSIAVRSGQRASWVRMRCVITIWGCSICHT